MLGIASIIAGGCDLDDGPNIDPEQVELRSQSQAETGGDGAEEDGPSPALQAGPHDIPGHYIVMLNKGANPHAAAAAVKAKPAHVYSRAFSGFAGPLAPGQVKALSLRKDVEMIEPDQVVSVAELECLTQLKSGAPDHAPAYSVDRIDQRDRPLSNSYTYDDTSNPVNVYVFDTWMYTEHPDFGGRATAGYDGYPNQPANGQTCSGHGTHVAGIVGGTQYGVAKTVNLISVEVLDCSGRGTWSKLLAGIDWVLANKGSTPAVANMSLSGSKSIIVNKAVENLANNGVFVAVAAGNANTDACKYSPSSAKNVMTVAANNSADERTSFSNYGSCVDIYAGGSNVRSAWSDGSSRTASGTSMASPHVAGVAALYKQVHGNAPTSTIKTYLETWASKDRIVGNPSNTPNRLLYWSCTASRPL